MTPQQYEHMTSMMAVCRTFLNHMQYCMKNEGLIEQGFDLMLTVCTLDNNDGRSFCRIQLEQAASVVGENEQYKNKMIQWKDDDGKWRIESDPIEETGTVSEMAQSRETNVTERVGETGNKPYPLDGLWLSASDNDSAVDGGM